jgi:hypothetical protein
MAFTGDLEHLPIVDIIQLVHTTRKSGIFFVKTDKGESKIVFRNGSIVSANHINNKVRIGSVLVKTGAITLDALRQAMALMKSTDKDHLPLLATLVQAGALKPEDALRGLKKLVEMTIVELMSWTTGTFTFDTDTEVVVFDGGQDLEVDAQMVLMDALRIFDERERDRAAGKVVPSFEELYADVLPEENTEKTESSVTADDLGLGDLDRLAIHSQKTKELLPDFSFEEQESFVAFLGKSVAYKPASDTAVHAGKAVVIFSGDMLIRHSVMTICKEDGVPVFATDDGIDLERIVSQCLSAMRMPVVVFDSPLRSEALFTEKKILNLRNAVMQKYPGVPVIQFASIDDADFFLQSYSDGVRAVFPKPLKELRRETFIHDTIQFLDTFKSFLKGFQERVDTTDRYVKELKDNIKLLRDIASPSDAAMVMLAYVADMFERAVTFLVRSSELIGERSVGVGFDKSAGPVRADKLKIPLSRPSVFRDVLEKGQAYYGENRDDTLADFFAEIGEPRSPAVVLVPVICDRKVAAVVYGDFGQKEAIPVQLDILEILGQQVGIVLEYALFRRQVAKAQKPEGQG